MHEVSSSKLDTGGRPSDVEVGEPAGAPVSSAPASPTSASAPISSASVSSAPVSPSGRPGRRRRFDGTPYLLILPATALLIGLMAYPIGKVIVLSTRQMTLHDIWFHLSGHFVGLANYTKILQDPFFWTVVRRTAIFTFATVGISVGLALAIALLMRRVSRWVRLIMTVAMILVWAMPMTVSTAVFKWMIDANFGVVNYLIGLIPGVDFTNHSWFVEPDQGWVVISGLVIWGALPFLAITLYAGLTQVPTELVEAATMDGANGLQVLRNVFLPVLRPVLIIVTTLSVIWDFQVFVQVWVLRDSKPEQAYWTLGVYAYEEAFGQSNYNAGAAISVLTLVMMFGVMVFYVRQMIRIGEAD